MFFWMTTLSWPNKDLCIVFDTWLKMISQSVLCVCFSLSLCCSCVLRWFLSSLNCSVCPPLSRGSYRPKEISIARYRRNVGSALSCSPLICGAVPNVALSSYGPCAINGLVESGAISTHPPFLPMSIFSFFHLFLRLFTLWFSFYISFFLPL